MRRLILFALAFIALSHPLAARGGDEVPAWLRGAASAPCPSYDSRVTAVVLRWDQTVRVDRSGRSVYETHYAVRVLRREGAGRAVARIPYRTDGGSVKALRAWVLPSSGEAHRCRDRDVRDMAALNGDMYNEVRLRILDASGDVATGSVFGFEAEQEEHSIFAQYEWAFQDELPVLRSRFSVLAPRGWRIESAWFNHDPVDPEAVQDGSAWELRDLPPIADEPLRPPATELAPRLAVSVLAPASTGDGDLISFRSWPEVSEWLSRLADPRGEPTGEVMAKARAITAGAETERERIDAVGRFVQGLTYASIQLGTTRGGGYVPRPAAEVLNRGYGDCKDKANLMKALLQALHIPAYLVLAYLGDPGYVREPWPSPHQFNHCIVAIRVTDPLGGPVCRDSTLGPLLLFDPTDPSVPLGSIPGEEQSGLALIIAGRDGRLVRLPRLPDEDDTSRRQIHARLEADGSITARIEERTTGRLAVAERRLFRQSTGTDYRKLMERWIARGATGTEITGVSAQDADSGRGFALDLEMRAARYAQNFGPKMLALPSVFIERGSGLMFPDSARTLPVVLRSEALEETTRTRLPEGFTVEEIPEPVVLEAPFGAYRLHCGADRDTLVVTRTYRLHTARVPPEDYPALRDFFARIHAGEQRSVVLSRN